MNNLGRRESQSEIVARRVDSLDRLQKDFKKNEGIISMLISWLRGVEAEN